MKRSAVISPCGRYRYLLRRKWGDGGRVLVFVMLNPSTADGEQDDPTIRRCINFAKAWGYDELIVVNLFALRATKPAMLWKDGVADPIGPENHSYCARAFGRAAETDVETGKPSGMVVCAWGANGSYMDQARTMVGWLESCGVVPHVLELTAKGEPRHPLYVKADTEAVPVQALYLA